MREPRVPYGPLTRLVTGLVLGMFLAGLFSAYAFLMWLWNDRSLGYLNVELGQVVLGYAIWGPIVGALVGLFFPVTRTVIGAAGAGAFIMAALYLTSWRILGLSSGEGAGLITLGIIVGGVGGLLMFGHYWAKVEDAERRQDDTG